MSLVVMLHSRCLVTAAEVISDGEASAERCRACYRDHQPFGGPLFVLFGKREHAIGGRLAAAMRVEVAGEGTVGGETAGETG